MTELLSEDQLVATEGEVIGIVAGDQRRATVSASQRRLFPRAGPGQLALGGFFRTATAGQSLSSPRFTRVSASAGIPTRMPSSLYTTGSV